MLRIFKLIKVGRSLNFISEELGLNISEIKKIIYSLDFKFFENPYQQRTYVLQKRKELLDKLLALPFKWDQYEMDKKILIELTTVIDDAVFTFADVANALSISEDMVTDSIARVRAMVRRTQEPQRGIQIG